MAYPNRTFQAVYSQTWSYGFLVSAIRLLSRLVRIARPQLTETQLRYFMAGAPIDTVLILTALLPPETSRAVDALLTTLAFLDNPWRARGASARRGGEPWVASRARGRALRVRRPSRRPRTPATR